MAGRRTAAISGDPAGEQAGPGLSIRLDPAPGLRLGPGKVRLLEEIGRNGSISAAGRALGMSYRRAWELVEDLNRGLGRPVVETAASTWSTLAAPLTISTAHRSLTSGPGVTPSRSYFTVGE